MRAQVDRSETRYNVFAFLWALTVLVDRAKRAQPDGDNLAVVVSGFLLLAFPGSVWLFALFAAIQVYFWVATLSAQIIWNVAGYLHLSLLLGMLSVVIRQHTLRVSCGDVAQAIAPPVRCICLVGMGFAGFAKLNQDFLEPSLSCGAIYYLWLTESPLFSFFPRSLAAQEMALLFAVTAELVGPVLVLWRKTRLLGLLLLWAVWLGLGLNPRSHYFDFAGLFAAMSIYFLPDSLVFDALRRVRNAIFSALRLARVRPSKLLARWLGRVLVVGVGIVLVFGRHLGIEHKLQLELYRVAVVGLWILCLLALSWAYFRSQARPTWPSLWIPNRTPLVWLAPALFFLNELSIYVGFPHRPALIMAANSLLTPAASNHLLVNPVPTFAWSARVEILRSSMKHLKRRENMPWLRFVDVMAQHPELKVTFRVEGGPTETVVAGTDPRFAHRSLLSQWLRLDTYSGRSSRRVPCDKAPPGYTGSQWRKEVGQRQKALRGK